MFTAVFIYFNDSFYFFGFIFYEFSLLSDFNLVPFGLSAIEKKRGGNVRIRCH